MADESIWGLMEQIPWVEYKGDMRCFAPCALIVVALNSSWLLFIRRTKVKRVLGTLLTKWKAFQYSPKRVEKLLGSIVSKPSARYSVNDVSTLSEKFYI